MLFAIWLCLSGLEPVQYYNDDQPFSLQCGEKSILQSMSNMLSLRERARREPYLVFAILFLCLRVLLHMFPKVLTHLKAFWVLYVPHFNLGIFGETSQLMGRIFHMVDVRRIWTKLRLCKTRNFHEGAKNARVWASSLTSVSLGESSSARSSSSWMKNLQSCIRQIQGRKELLHLSNQLLWGSWGR